MAKGKMGKPSKIFSIFLALFLCFQQTGFAQVAEQLDISSRLGGLRNILSPDQFRPLHLRYLSYDSLKNNFNLLLDRGDLKDAKASEIKSVSGELLKYFLIGLALPNDSFWVNLRPDSPDNIIDTLLAQTDLGKIMLEADLQLKKDTAKATSPETAEGKLYWEKLYQKAGELFGRENVTIPTLTRPWIVPDEIIIGESADSAYIYKATLKVCLEEDYLKSTNAFENSGLNAYNFSDPRLKVLNEYSSQLIKELIIPRLTREINSAKRYAPLRQVYYSLIMASWFKARNLNRNNQYSKLIDQKNITNFASQIPWSKDTYFLAYQENFQKGEYNLQLPIYTPSGQVIRSYFSGGISGILPTMPALGQSIIPGPDSFGPRISSSPINGRNFGFSGRKYLVPMVFAGALVLGGIFLPGASASAQEMPAQASAIAVDETNDLIGVIKNQEVASYERWNALELLVRNQDSRVVEPVIDVALNDPDLDLRRVAVKTLGTLKDPRVVPLLIKLASDPNEDFKLRYSAIMSLVSTHDPAGVEVLSKLLNNPDENLNVRSYAADGLGILGDPGSVELLIKVALNEPPGEVKNSAILALRKFQLPQARDTLIFLAQARQSLDARLSAIYALGNFSDAETLVALIALLGDPNPSVCVSVIKDLSNYHNPDVLDKLINVALHGEDERMRVDAAKICLINFNDSRALDVLMGILENTLDDVMQHYAANVLSESDSLEVISRLTQLALRTIRPHAAARDIKLHTEVAFTLGNINNPLAIDPLIRLLSDADVGTRRAAIYALSKFSDPRVIDSLISKLFDKEDEVHSDAVWSLRELDALGTVENLITRLLSETNAVKAGQIAVSLGEIGFKILPETHRYKRLIDCFHYRKADIQAGGFSPQNMFIIYSSPGFRLNTDEFNYVNQFGMARGVESILTRFNQPINNDNINKVMPFILSAWNGQSQRLIVNKDTRVIACFHEEERFDQQGFANFMREQFGINTDDPEAFASFKGSHDYDELVKAKEGLRKKIEDPSYDLLYFDNHGSTLDVWLTFGPIGTVPGRHFDDKNMTLNYKELSQNLLRRAKNNRGELGDLTIIVGACYSADFIVNTYNELVKAYLAGQIKSLPLIITATSRGTVGYQIFDKMALVAKDKAELRLADFYKVATLVWDMDGMTEEMTFFLPLSPEALNQLKASFGIKGKIKIPAPEPGAAGPEFKFTLPDWIMPLGEPYEGQIVPVNPNIPALIVRSDDVKDPVRASSPVNTNPPDKQIGAYFDLELKLNLDPALASTNRLTGASSPVKKPDKLGGIDFRSLPIVTQARGSLSVNLPKISPDQLNRIDLNLEWQGIEKTLEAGITPSAERIKEYVQLSCFKDKIDNDLDKIIGCIADILRTQEGDCSLTEPVLRDMLTVLESNNNRQELEEIFIGNPATLNR